jgi:hypothetical protein
MRTYHSKDSEFSVSSAPVLIQTSHMVMISAVRRCAGDTFGEIQKRALSTSTPGQGPDEQQPYDVETAGHHWTDLPRQIGPTPVR